jgi:hypothetical protein
MSVLAFDSIQSDIKRSINEAIYSIMHHIDRKGAEIGIKEDDGQHHTKTEMHIGILLDDDDTKDPFELEGGNKVQVISVYVNEGLLYVNTYSDGWYDTDPVRYDSMHHLDILNLLYLVENK